MTRPAGSVLVRGAKQCALVLDGNEVKLRLIAERAESRTPVHVDWVRFTVIRRNVPACSVDALFPLANGDAFVWERLQEFHRELSKVPDCDNAGAMQAIDLATVVADAMGPDFKVAAEVRKGHDFYRHRIAIERNGAEVGWVGFGASSDSPKQDAQRRTLHVNLFGAACTFGAPRWNHRIAEIASARSARVTRVDLALDFFDGLPGGIKRAEADYNAGLMNVGGHRPKCNHLGDWSDHSKGGRSFYFGSKQAGKQTNVYEKGDQLFGVEQGSAWMRVELRYGDKLRVLPVDMLTRPADFFAGASDWHAVVLAEADAIPEPEPVSCVERLPLETVKAECSRVLRWARDTAGASLAFAVRELPEAVFVEMFGEPRLPGRLRRMGATASQIAEAVASLVPSFGGAGPAAEPI